MIKEVDGKYLYPYGFKYFRHAKVFLSNLYKPTLTSEPKIKETNKSLHIFRITHKVRCDDALNNTFSFVDRVDTFRIFEVKEIATNMQCYSLIRNKGLQ